MASTSFADVLPTQATRRAALAVTSTATSSASTETSGIRTTTPIRRTTPHSSPSPRPRPTTVRGSVPANLVGTWSGGSEGETAGSSYTFASNGRFLIRRPGGSITGVAVARSGTITFSFSGKSVTSGYSVTELPEVDGYQSLNLEIGGYSSVRDV